MIRKQSRQFYSEINQIADSQAFLDSLHEGFGGVENPSYCLPEFEGD